MGDNWTKLKSSLFLIEYMFLEGFSNFLCYKDTNNDSYVTLDCLHQSIKCDLFLAADLHLEKGHI